MIVYALIYADRVVPEVGGSAYVYHQNTMNTW